MTKPDLIREVTLKQTGILAIHYRKKIDIKNLDYQVKTLIGSLEMFIYSNTGKDDIRFKNIIDAISKLKNAIVKLQKLELYIAPEKCRAIFDEAKKLSLQAIDKMLAGL